METMNKWVVEFFLRHQQNPRAYPTTLFSALKFENVDGCLKLKVTAVLRDISNSLIRGTVDEGMLDFLEILEKLLLQEHSVIMESLKSAYCWSALECTIKFMWPVTASEGLFSDALERIWTKRIGILKERESDLVTDELLKWENDLKKALEEPEIYQTIRETNIRYIAISHLSQLLKEHWALLGCSSLESEARERLLKRKYSNASPGNNLGRASDSIDNVNEEHQMGESEGIIGSNREKAHDVDAMGEVEKANDVDAMGEVEKADDVDKATEQEEEHEPILNMGDITVAKELKDCLLEIQGLIHSSSMQVQEPNNPVDHSLDVPSQTDGEKVGGEDHKETENSQGTSSSSGRVRPHLPTPKSLNVSPLKKGKLINPRPRRTMKFWTPEEMEALKKGVKEYGKSWKDIKMANPVVFVDRTEVDLKDKWRNFLGR